MEGKFICSSNHFNNILLFTLPDIWFVLLVDVVLKIESKLLCLNDFKTFYHFSCTRIASKEAIEGLCVRGREDKRRRGRSEEMVRRRQFWKLFNSLKLQPGYTYYIPSTELKLVCLEKRKLRRLILEIGNKRSSQISRCLHYNFQRVFSVKFYLKWAFCKNMIWKSGMKKIKNQ